MTLRGCGAAPERTAAGTWFRRQPINCTCELVCPGLGKVRTRDSRHDATLLRIRGIEAASVLCPLHDPPCTASFTMSWTPTPEPQCTEPQPAGTPGAEASTLGADSTSDIELIIDARKRDLGGFSVGRILPAVARRTVGPFIFFDHMGPVDFQPGAGVDVRPHPHINLATVTYLFAGEILHRDSLGSEQEITPGAVNWMNAGRGIVHSERTPQKLRASGYHLHGLQLWIALPTAHEESAPAFTHYPKASLPEKNVDGATVRVLAGEAYGMKSPVATYSRLLYVDVQLPAGGNIVVPRERECAMYVVEGDVRCGRETANGGRLLVFRPDATPSVHAETPTRLVFIGGDPLDGVRHIYWNFVSSSLDRLEHAKADWREGRFPLVPGDEHEFIPLPDDGSTHASARRAES